MLVLSSCPNTRRTKVMCLTSVNFAAVMVPLHDKVLRSNEMDQGLKTLTETWYKF